MSHTISLYTDASGQRQGAAKTWSEHETTSMAIEGLIERYETRLKQLNPHLRQISYDISELKTYIDSCDVCFMVLDPRLGTYNPHPTDWVKNKVELHLKKMSANGY
ncbi:hypothetical protein HDV00_000268 [Rhizophlyctis rosea]|nr:hypothetical protein HDV00_000268 [Rhizophlyctis rosea]